MIIPTAKSFRKDLAADMFPIIERSDSDARLLRRMQHYGTTDCLRDETVVILSSLYSTSWLGEQKRTVKCSRHVIMGVIIVIAISLLAMVSMIMM
eukprot:scaffold28410_cov51-Attheya_sp.AAC.6